MAEAFSAIGGLVSKLGGLGNVLKGGMTGMGLIGNIMAQQKQNAALNRIAYYQKNPAAAAAVVRSLTQPLNAGLVQGVGNEVQGYLGERGLSGSPNITAGVLGQQLAPYMQQNQMTAEQMFQNLLNPAGATYQQPSNLASLMSLWKPLPTAGNPSPIPSTTPLPTPSTFPYPDINSMDTYGSASA